MIPLIWSAVLLSLSFNSAGSSVIIKESGGNLTLKCTSKGSSGYLGMYLYHKLHQKKEVLFYSKHPSERPEYLGRIKANGSLLDNTITICNLTVDDSGVYTCDYKSFTDQRTYQNYTVFVKGAASCPKPHITPAEDKTLLSVLTITAASSITVLFLIFIFLITSRVRKMRSSRRARGQESNEYVYEVMTNNGFQPVTAPNNCHP